MNSSETTFFRAGYVTSLEAWKPYLADGHNIHFRAKPDKPDQDEDEDESEDEDQDEEDDNDGNGDDENRRPPPSEEAREMMEKSDAIFQFVSRSRQAFRSFYRKAPLEVRTRLVLPHTFTRIVKLDSKGGKFFEWNMFIPTSSSGPSMRTKGPSDIDRERIQAFIDGANSLIKDDARREAGGFKLSEPDFKFERIPEGAVSRPLLSQKELKDIISVGPQSARLWGITPPEFLRLYYHE